MNTLVKVLLFLVFASTVLQLNGPLGLLIGIFSIAMLLSACRCCPIPSQNEHPEWIKSEVSLQ